MGCSRIQVSSLAGATSTPKTSPFLAQPSLNQKVCVHGLTVHGGTAGYVELKDAHTVVIASVAAATTGGGGIDFAGGRYVDGPLKLTNATSLTGSVAWH